MFRGHPFKRLKDVNTTPWIFCKLIHTHNFVYSVAQLDSADVRTESVCELSKKSVIQKGIKASSGDSCRELPSCCLVFCFSEEMFMAALVIPGSLFLFWTDWVTGTQEVSTVNLFSPTRQPSSVCVVVGPPPGRGSDPGRIKEWKFRSPSLTTVDFWSERRISVAMARSAGEPAVHGLSQIL